MTRFFKQVALPIFGVFCSAVALQVVVNAVEPIVIAVGMPWREADAKIERVACFKNFSSLQMYVSGPATPGPAEYECKYGYKFYQFLDNQCLCVVLRAPFSRPLDQGDWHIHQLELGPRFRGYGGKTAWLDASKTYQEEFDLGAYRWLLTGSWGCAIIASFGVFLRWMRNRPKDQSRYRTAGSLTGATFDVRRGHSVP